jgi:Raf kinase inhibitor-like YbhB/YbcL family protein
MKREHIDVSSVQDFVHLEITSTAFKQSADIPERYTCEGENINPPLQLAHLPARAVSLAIIMDDPDAASGPFLHWLAWNIPATHHITEQYTHGMMGINGAHRGGYTGPCPPSGKHRYFFNVYALDTVLDISPGATRKELEQAMSGHILAYGELMGKYQKKIKL